MPLKPSRRQSTSQCSTVHGTCARSKPGIQVMLRLRVPQGIGLPHQQTILSSKIVLPAGRSHSQLACMHGPSGAKIRTHNCLSKLSLATFSPHRTLLTPTLHTERLITIHLQSRTRRLSLRHAVKSIDISCSLLQSSKRESIRRCCSVLSLSQATIEQQLFPPPSLLKVSPPRSRKEKSIHIHFNSCRIKF